MIYHNILPKEYMAEAGIILYDAFIDKFAFANPSKEVGERLFQRMIGAGPVLYSVNNNKLDGGLIYSFPNKEMDISTKGFFSELGLWTGFKTILNLIYIEIALPQQKDTVFIDGLAVAPTSRGRGIGRQLLMKVSELAKENNNLPVGLSVVAENKVAHGLYKSVGFNEIGEKRFGKMGKFFKIDYSTNIIMRKENL